jgi:hypothetical protein
MLFTVLCPFTVSEGADLKNKRTCPDGSYGLFLPADKKLNQLHTHSRSSYWLLVKHKVRPFKAHYFIRTVLKQPSVLSTAMNESIIAPLKAGFSVTT